jgi:hypothetical protein
MARLSRPVLPPNSCRMACTASWSSSDGSPVWAAPNQPNRIDGIESLLTRVLDDAADAPPLAGLHHVDTPFGVSPNAVN